MRKTVFTVIVLVTALCSASAFAASPTQTTNEFRAQSQARSVTAEPLVRESSSESPYVPVSPSGAKINTRPCKNVQHNISYYDPVWPHPRWATYYLNVRFCWDGTNVYGPPGVAAPIYWGEASITNWVNATWEWAGTEAGPRYWMSLWFDPWSSDHAGYHQHIRGIFTRCFPFPHVCGPSLKPHILIDVWRDGYWTKDAYK